MIVSLCAIILPTLFYVMLICWLDRYEKEPFYLLLAAFLWGALPSVFITLWLGDIAGLFLGPYLSAPLIEELIKAIALIVLFIFARKEFDGVLDGIIYGAVIGSGFSMSENLLYFFQKESEFSFMLWFRIVMLGFGHAFFTSIVGIGLGIVRYENRRWVGYIVFPLSLILAISIHQLSNIAISQRLVGLFLGWMIESGGLIILLLISALSWKEEQRYLIEELREEVASGLIKPYQYRVVSSGSLSFRFHLFFFYRGKMKLFFQQERIYQLISELAFHKHRLRIQDPYCKVEEIDRIRKEITLIQQELAYHNAFYQRSFE